MIINVSTMGTVSISQILFSRCGTYSRVVKGYRQVSIPDAFYEEIDEFVKGHPRLGYTSIAEFVKVAVREKMESLKIESNSTATRWIKEGKKKG